MPELAFEIQSGQELERYVPNEVMISGKTYFVLTGYEGTGRCFWCGAELTGKLKRYCYGHMIEYYRYFEWPSARRWCCERQDGLCANCGLRLDYSLEVHHIVPLNGSPRYFTAFNLPWNLIGFCHDHHQEIHAVMREAFKLPVKDVWELAMETGQGIMADLLTAG